jgi:hypothetical protein
MVSDGFGVIWHWTCQADLQADLEVRALSSRMVEE